MSGEGDDPLAAKPGYQALFLERRSYRRRRLMDAARLLPVLGASLFMIPLLWQDAAVPVADGEVDRGVTTSGAYLYIFLAWGILIACAAAFGHILRKWAEAGVQQGRGQG